MLKRFLVVDDDPVSNKICDFTIKKVINGAEVSCFQYPAEGLAYIKANYGNHNAAPTVLILDINMPEINGWAFLEEFQKMDPSVHEQFRIYIVSTSIDHADRERAQAHPLVKDFLQKPLSPGMLRVLFLNSN